MDATAGWKENLEKFKAGNKTVEIYLQSGVAFKGKIKSIDVHSVVLTELAGRALEDAMVRISDITALVVRNG